MLHVDHNFYKMSIISIVTECNKLTLLIMAKSIIVFQMCDSQKIFLTWMNVIWDCYLHFVRHYGDFLPGVFDPLPFLDLPKVCTALLV